MLLKKNGVKYRFKCPHCGSETGDIIERAPSVEVLGYDRLEITGGVLVPPESSYATTEISDTNGPLHCSECKEVFRNATLESLIADETVWVIKDESRNVGCTVIFIGVDQDKVERACNRYYTRECESGYQGKTFFYPEQGLHPSRVVRKLPELLGNYIVTNSQDLINFIGEQIGKGLIEHDSVIIYEVDENDDTIVSHSYSKNGYIKDAGLAGFFSWRRD